MLEPNGALSIVSADDWPYTWYRADGPTAEPAEVARFDGTGPVEFAAAPRASRALVTDGFRLFDVRPGDDGELGVGRELADVPAGSVRAATIGANGDAWLLTAEAGEARLFFGPADPEGARFEEVSALEAGLCTNGEAAAAVGADGRLVALCFDRIVTYVGGELSVGEPLFGTRSAAGATALEGNADEVVLFVASEARNNEIELARVVSAPEGSIDVDVFAAIDTRDAHRVKLAGMGETSVVVAVEEEPGSWRLTVWSEGPDDTWDDELVGYGASDGEGAVSASGGRDAAVLWNGMNGASDVLFRRGDDSWEATDLGPRPGWPQSASWQGGDVRWSHNGACTESTSLGCSAGALGFGSGGTPVVAVFLASLIQRRRRRASRRAPRS